MNTEQELDREYAQILASRQPLDIHRAGAKTPVPVPVVDTEPVEDWSGFALALAGLPSEEENV
jgi:hypothetical protein